MPNDHTGNSLVTRSEKKFTPAHPGEVLREDFLKPLDLSQYAPAKTIDVPQIRVPMRHIKSLVDSDMPIPARLLRASNIARLCVFRGDAGAKRGVM